MKREERKGGREGESGGGRDRETHRSEMTAGKLNSRASQLLSGQIHLGLNSSSLDHPKGRSLKTFCSLPQNCSTGTRRLRSWAAPYWWFPRVSRRILTTPGLLSSPISLHCSETTPGSGRREEEPGQGRQVKDAPPAFPPENHFPSLQSQCCQTLRALYWVKLCLIKHISENSFIPSEAEGRPSILTQAFLKSFLSMTISNFPSHPPGPMSHCLSQ